MLNKYLFQTHSGSVWRVTWAHPEFGQVLATCSFDRTAAVWEEIVGDPGRDGNHSNWVKKSSLVDSRTSVTDVKFGPKHLGLQLVSIYFSLQCIWFQNNDIQYNLSIPNCSGTG